MNHKKRLQKLLNSYAFYRADDGAYYTPKQDFIDSYEAMITDGIAYFDKLAEDSYLNGSDDLCEEREIFTECGGGADGAYEVTAYHLDLLNRYTVEPKQTVVKSTQKLFKQTLFKRSKPYEPPTDEMETKNEQADLLNIGASELQSEQKMNAQMSILSAKSQLTNEQNERYFGNRNFKGIRKTCIPT